MYNGYTSGSSGSTVDTGASILHELSPRHLPLVYAPHNKPGRRNQSYPHFVRVIKH